MNLKELQNKKIAIAGLGVEGMATAEYLQKHAIEFTVLDERVTEESDVIAQLVTKKINYQIGTDVFSQLQIYDIVFRSPGISPLRKELVAAKEKGAIITSQTKLFFDLCPAPIVGVTGTKGKGTTSTLIYEMLQKQGVDVYLGGNIGVPPLSFLDKLNPQSKVVLELSSFQLMDLEKSPHIAVVLMITSEHLDYHKDILEYVDAKRNIVRFQDANDIAIINRDYIASNESDVHTNGQVFQVSVERECARGCFIKDGKVILKKIEDVEEIIATKQIFLPGKHNLENVCAAVMAAAVSGVSKENIVSVLKTFKGLPHRLQLVRELHGVKYYDDSFSTTPETARAAVDAFTQPEILILGGSSKNSDFSELGKTIRLSKHIKAIIGVGYEWERIKEAIGERVMANSENEILVVEGATNMFQIVQAANKIAQSGDIVLLSPGCASFGMFKNYKNRGELFQKEVKALQ